MKIPKSFELFEAISNNSEVSELFCCDLVNSLTAPLVVFIVQKGNLFHQFKNNYLHFQVFVGHLQTWSVMYHASIDAVG